MVAQIIDPYVTGDDADAHFAKMNDLPPPAAAMSSGADSVLQLYIPAEDTILDYGAGTTPGIRMITEHHAHITTRTPPSTLSLGAPAGALMAFSNPGIVLYTAEHKTEQIHLTTTETYDGAAKLAYGDTKEEKVHGPWNESCDSTKTEKVHGAWKETCDDAKTETVKLKVVHEYQDEYFMSAGKASVYTYKAPKSQTVDGDYTLFVNGKKNETIKQKSDVKYLDAKMDVFSGLQTSCNLGGKIGLDSTVTVAITSGAGLAVNNTLAVTRNAVTHGTTLLDLAEEGMSVEKIEATIATVTGARIVSAVFNLLK